MAITALQRLAPHLSALALRAARPARPSHREMERRLTAGSRFALHAAKAQVVGMQKDSLRSPLAHPGAALRDMPLRGTSGAVLR